MHCSTPLFKVLGKRGALYKDGRKTLPAGGAVPGARGARAGSHNKKDPKKIIRTMAWASFTKKQTLSPLCGIPSGCCFFMGPWTVTRSSHAVSGRCVLTATAACVPCGVVSVLAEPSSWHTGVVLVVAGVILQFLLPTALHAQVIHHMPRRVSVCLRPNCSTHRHVVLVVHHLPPHAAACIGPNYSISARGAHGHCTHLHGFPKTHALKSIEYIMQ